MFYTEYGKYPLPGLPGGTPPDYYTYGPGGDQSNNQLLLTELRGCTAPTGSCPAAATINTRQVVFISPPDVKNSANPRSGVALQTTTINGISVVLGDLVDPWGAPYVVRIDSDYNNQVANPYTANAGATPNLQLGVIAWSIGLDESGPPTVTGGDKNTGVFAD